MTLHVFWIILNESRKTAKCTVFRSFSKTVLTVIADERECTVFGSFSIGAAVVMVGIARYLDHSQWNEPL